MPAKTIITCTITGSIHTPPMSPHLPVTAGQIAQSAVEAAGAGAAVIHLHARNPDPEALMFMKSTADRLFGRDYLFSVPGAGRHQFPLVTMGGNVRVGLEDNLYLSRGRLAPSNAAQVAKIRHIPEELGLETASADEARAMLATKGAAQVNF